MGQKNNPIELMIAEIPLIKLQIFFRLFAKEIYATFGESIWKHISKIEEINGKAWFGPYGNLFGKGERRCSIIIFYAHVHAYNPSY